ncbi:hypothetical protein FUAX_26690 [Fulvitalea axinellae]|uniref:LPP20 lipoprotein n=1 Tax=Fulvitalea axinellae TaxID=1182444 RepID=A0AAU9CXP4_9BACT|nr:hypothetical protein FUAX_26690 [Fulvitalea axinellae]
MKTRKLFIISAMALATGFMASCGGSKKAAQTGVQPDEVEIVVHCSGPEYYSNGQFIRANSMGESLDLTLSKKKARNNTLQELAGKIETSVQSVIDNYQKSAATTRGEELSKRYEELTREVIKQKISGYTTLCEKVTKSRDGKYRTYLAYEISVDNLLKPLSDRISKDESLKMDYDYEKFKDTFESALKEYENQR